MQDYEDCRCWVRLEVCEVRRGEKENRKRKNQEQENNNSKRYSSKKNTPHHSKMEKNANECVACVGT